MPANITFPEFVSETVLFQNKDAANAFFHAITIPDATTLAEGAVKQAHNVTFSPAAYGNEDQVLFAIVGGTNVYVPTMEHTEAIKTRLEAAEAALALVLTRLKNAGIMANS